MKYKVHIVYLSYRLSTHMEHKEAKELAKDQRPIFLRILSSQAVLLILSIVVALAIMEIALRVSGWEPENGSNTSIDISAEENEKIESFCDDGIGVPNTTFFTVNANGVGVLLRGCDEEIVTAGIDPVEHIPLSSGHSFSPDRSKLLLRHTVNADYIPSISKFSFYITGIIVVDVEDPSRILYRVDPEDWDLRATPTYIEWSPDGRHISYLLENREDADSLVIVNVETGEEVFREIDKETSIERPAWVAGRTNSESAKLHNEYYDAYNRLGLRPVSWRNSEQFSYVSDGVLYLVNLDDHSHTILDEGVTNQLYHSFEWEGIDPKYPVQWSPDGRYAVYYKTETAVINDLLTGGKYYFGEPIKANKNGWIDFHGLSLTSIGWINDSSFLYREYRDIFVVRAEKDSFIKEKVGILGGQKRLGDSVLLTERGMLLYNDNNAYGPVNIFDLNEDKLMCSESDIKNDRGMLWKYQVVDGKVFALVRYSPTSAPDGHFNYSDPGPYDYTDFSLYDMNTCKMVAFFSLAQ